MSAWDIFWIIWACGWLLTCVIAYHVMRGEGHTRREFALTILLCIPLWWLHLGITSWDWEWMGKPIGHKEDKEDK